MLAAGPLTSRFATADLRRIDGGVEQVVLAVSPSVTAEERLAFTPATAGDDLALDLDHEIRPVVDQGRIDAEDGLKRALDLQLGIIVALQLAHRARSITCDSRGMSARVASRTRATFSPEPTGRLVRSGSTVRS